MGARRACGATGLGGAARSAPGTSGMLAGECSILASSGEYARAAQTMYGHVPAMTIHGQATVRPPRPVSAITLWICEGWIGLGACGVVRAASWPVYDHGGPTRVARRFPGDIAIPAGGESSGGPATYSGVGAGAWV